MKLLTLNNFIRVVLVAVTLLLLTACATNPVTGKSEVVLMSEEQEQLLGAQQHTQSILKQYKVYDHPALQAYIEQLGQELAGRSHRNHLDFTFTLLDSPQVNAFALPGGYIYVTRGIMAYMNNEEQLAGVLGHEIGHVTARHGVRQHRNQTVTGIGGLLIAVATGNQQITQAATQVAGAWNMGYGRENELEADRLGAEYLARANYDPVKMLGVVEILKNQEEFEIQRAREEGREPRVYHGVFSTHPKNDLRLQTVVRAAGKFKNPDAVETNPEEFLRLMSGVTFGDSEEQGIIRENKFYHKALDVVVDFPQGWRIENQPSQLVAIRPDGEAAMIINVGEPEEGESAAQFLHRKFENLQNGQSLDRGGYTGITSGKHPFGNGAFRVATVPHKEKIFIIAGFAKSDRPDQLIVNTANSIRKLKEDEIKFASAQQIKLVRIKSGDTFSRLALQSGLGQFAEEKLRLLNGMYPEGEPAVGQLIKIVR